MVSDKKSDEKLQNDAQSYPLRRTSARLNRGEKKRKMEAESSSKVDLKRKREKRPVELAEKKQSKMEEHPAENQVELAEKKQNQEEEQAAENPVAKGAHAAVTNTLRIFNKYYLHFYQEEGNRFEASKKANTGNDSAKKTSKRPDLKAISEMTKSGESINVEDRIGAIAGIDIGHQFFSRAEMVVVGLHHHWLNGINFAGKSVKSPGFENYRLPVALSIVMSGQYEDDHDNCENITYTGQGGNNLLGDKRQIKNQVMERGNLALKSSMEQNLPVRLIRGHKCPESYAGKVYTYDGLYKVDKYWADTGVSGFTVYKFGLVRIEGQPPLTTKEVYFTRAGRIPKSISDIRGLVCEDVTGGLEDIPIPVTNTVDDPPVSPPSFVYTKRMKFSKNISGPSTYSAVGCKCKGMCTDPGLCGCAKLNGGGFPYVNRDGGRLLEPKAVVFECGPHCGCGPSCINRISQQGIRFRLEVFRTPKKGWGVRSWDYIPSGAPICEYIGLVRRTQDLSLAADNTYVFDIDCLQTMKGLEGRESRFREVCLPSHLQKACEEVTEMVPFCIDAAEKGNVARFINHSCQPNLFIQCMLGEHQDIKLAKVMLIAADCIPPLTELTYDYGYTLDSVLGPDGKIQQMFCFCGANECRKRLY